LSIEPARRPPTSRGISDDAVAPPPHHPRFPLTVGLRGIAAIAIIVGHAWFFTGGFGGFTTSLPNRLVVRWDGVVAIFFMLSAFLLYRPMIARRAGGPASPTVSAYAWRRFLRLYPAYWVALTGLAIFPGLFGVFSHNWWAFYSLTDFLDLNHIHSVCPPSEEFRCGLPQSWTLGIDLTFYVALPFYAGLTALLTRGRGVAAWMRIELILVALLAFASLWAGGHPLDLRGEEWFRYSFIGHFYWFALGLGLAVISVAYSHRRSPPAPIRFVESNPLLCWAAGFAVYLITVFAFSDAPFVFDFNNSEYLLLNLVQGVGGLLFFLPAVFGNPNRGLPAKILGHPALMWVGLISYGLLLWHGTVAVMLGSLFGSGEGYWTVLIAEIVIAVPIATLSYYLIEKPLMRLKYRSPREIWRSRPPRDRRPLADPGGR
jgi:peptidoglycan/LPS O-acetylase OafA/YrhL